MGRWLLASLLAFLATLTTARYLSGPSWVVFLWLAAGFASASVAFALAWIAWRIWPAHAKGMTALALAISAAAGRSLLLASLLAPHRPHPTIELWPLSVATASVVWGLLALVWGTSAIADHLETPPEERPGRVFLAASAVAVILGLFCLAPLWTLLGLRISAWTVLGLAVLVSGAYLLDRIHRHLANRGSRTD